MRTAPFSGLPLAGLLLCGAAALLVADLAPAQKLQWDVPVRGAHVYRRTTRKFEVSPPPSRLDPTIAIQDGTAAEPHRWRYFSGPLDRAPAGFEKPGFDDSQWPIGVAGFGPDPAAEGNHRTIWKEPVLCARTTCDLGRSRPKALWFELDHDDGVRVWLNGELIVAEDQWARGRQVFVTGKALKAWQYGDNVVAVQCVNTGGAQYCDVELRYFSRLPRGVRDEDLEREVREQRAAANRVSGALFGPYRPPAMLLHGELDEERQFVRHNPVDLREVAAWVATDLRCGATGGAVKLDSRRVWELGDLKIRGRATDIDASGWQTITADVETTKEPERGKDSANYLRTAVMRFVHHGFEGQLRVRRRVEVRESGARVVEFETDFTGEIRNGPDFKQPAAGFEQREHWLLQTTHDNRDTAFRLMVKNAIEKGCARLREQLSKPNERNETKAEDPNGDRSYHSGRLAIGLLALIKGGVAKDDEVLVRCLEELRKRTLVDTYSIGNALMAIESYYQPDNEIGLLRSGSIDRPQKRKLPDADRELMQKWVGRLMTNIDTRVDPAYLLRFNYIEGGRYDNSTHQYGLLGLYAAHLCGVELPSTVWEAAANHLLEVQEEDGPRQRLELMDYRTHTRLQFDPDANVTVAQSSVDANGWSYMDAIGSGGEEGIWGSMTCAGITGLSICQAALLDYEGVSRKKLQGAADQSRLQGFAWLARNFTVRYHPGALTRQRRWLYYYLYGLERAALLSGVALIQNRDWYFEGAMMLVLAQQQDGDWPGELNGDDVIERNAMAILFLKQSTSPVLTGK